MENRMKFNGSRTIKIQCRDCPELSKPFRVTLCDQSEELIFIWKGNDFPKGWDIPEDEGLYEDIVYGYCPEHNYLLCPK